MSGYHPGCPGRSGLSFRPSSEAIMRLISILALLLALSAYASAQAPSKPLQLNFTGSTTSSDGFRAATDEYRDILAKEGTRIVAAMERATGLWFEDGPIDVIVYEGPSFLGSAEAGRCSCGRAT